MLRVNYGNRFEVQQEQTLFVQFEASTSEYYAVNNKVIEIGQSGFDFHFYLEQQIENSYTSFVHYSDILIKSFVIKFGANLIL